MSTGDGSRFHCKCFECLRRGDSVEGRVVSRATYWRHRDASAAREVIWEDAIQSKDDVESMDDIEEDVEDSDVDDDSDGVTDEGGFGDAARVKRVLAKIEKPAGGLNAKGVMDFTRFTKSGYSHLLSSFSELMFEE